MSPYRDFQEKSGQRVIYKERAVWYSPGLDDANEKELDVVYLGSEFCERCLPDEGLLRHVVTWCNAQEVKFVLVTPLVTNFGFKKIQKLLSVLMQNSSSYEVVVNDWGVLRMIQREFVSCEISLGRTLVTPHFPPGPFLNCKPTRTHKAKWVIPGYVTSRKPYSTKIFFDAVRHYGVKRIEFNTAYQSNACTRLLEKYGIKSHLYIPYTYICRTRFCNCVNEFHGYYRNSAAECNNECQRVSALLYNQDSSKTILVKGNAYFVDQRTWGINIKTRVNRVILNDIS